MNRLFVGDRFFFSLLLFRFMIVLAYQVTAVVAGWHLYQLTHDPLALGLIGLSELVPYFSFALFAGYAIDHYSRKLFGVVACLLLVVNSLTLAALSSGAISANPTRWIYAAIAVGGVARAFISPSYTAIFAAILPRGQYARAAGLGSSVFQLGLIVGPALGGVVLAGFGKTAAYGMAAGCALLASLALATIRVGQAPAAEGAPIFRSIAEGFRFVFGNEVVLGAQSLDMFAVLFGGATSLLPAFVNDIFLAGPEGLGLLRAAPAVGSLVTALLLARRPVRVHNGKWLLGSVAGFGMCIIAFALAPGFWVAALFLLLSGVCDGVSVVTRTTIMQLATPDEIRGRVAAINGLFIGSSNELGAFESGVAARLLGLVPSVIFGGVMTLVVVASTAMLAPRLRRLDLMHLE